MISSTYYCQMIPKILTNFQMYISVPFMKLRQQFRRLCCFFKIQSWLYSKTNTLLYNPVLPSSIFQSQNRSLFCLNKWNRLDNLIKSSESYLTFSKRLLNLIEQKSNETNEIHHPIGLKLIAHPGVGLNHLNDHKLNHNFKDSINLLCSCKLTLIWRGREVILTPSPPGLSCWFSLNNSETIKTVTLAFCSISLEIPVPNLVSITRPSFQTLGKTQARVFPISLFLVNPL